LKRDAPLGIEFASLCAMRTAWLRVYLDVQLDSPRSFSLLYQAFNARSLAK
jgi:hypothetical protein